MNIVKNEVHDKGASVKSKDKGMFDLPSATLLTK